MYAIGYRKVSNPLKSYTSGGFPRVHSQSSYASSYHNQRRNSDGQDTALDKLAKNYEQKSGPYLHAAVGAIFGTSNSTLGRYPRTYRISNLSWLLGPTQGPGEIERFVDP